MTFMNIAHRGGAGLRPENTLAAFRHAIELGADAAELDVHLTKDRQIVVHHNGVLDHNMVRKPSGEWLRKDERIVIAEHTYDELRQYEVGIPNPDTSYRNKYPDLVPVEGERIATLSEVIELAKEMSNNFKLIIEFKSQEANAANRPWVALVERTIEIVREHGFEERTIFCAFDWGALRYAKQLCPGIPTWYTTHPLSWLRDDDIPPADLSPSKQYVEKLRTMMHPEAPWYAGFDPRKWGESYPAAISAAGGDAWFMYHTTATKERIQQTHAAGLKAIVWTSGLRDIQVLLDLANRGLDGICADYPDFTTRSDIA